MRLFGYEVAVRKAARNLSSVDDSRQWTTLLEGHGWPYWQGATSVDLSPDRALGNWAYFACLTLIASDIGKLAPQLKAWDDADQIYLVVKSNAVSPVLTTPNGYETWPKFMQRWTLSKVGRGNAYALKVRDNRGVVVQLHILDPDRVTPMVSDSGDVFYRLNYDRLAGIPDADVVVPASEIIHDRMYCIFHPLVGLSPVFANCLAAVQGLEIQGMYAKFFKNSAVPSGVLVTPQRIEDALALKYKTAWETNFGGENRGRTAVLGNGLDYKALTQSAVDSQVIDQLKLSAEMVCSTFHVPPWKIGIGPLPAQSAEVMNITYYSDCLQSLITETQAALRDGLDLAQKGYTLHFNLDDLLLMDTNTQMDVITKGVQGRVLAPNEGRQKLNKPPVDGGDVVLAQHQDHSLAAIAARDAGPDPFGATAKPNNPAADVPPADSAKIMREAAELLRNANPHSLKVVNG